MSAEQIKYKGVITVSKYRCASIERGPNGHWRTIPGTGELVEQRKVDNVFLNTGKDWAIQRLFDDTASVVSGTAAQCFYVGTSASGGAAAATDVTSSNVEIGRLTFTYASGATRGAMSGTATFITNTANGAITEAGIFAGGTTSGDGAFIARVLFAAINKTSADTLQVKWDVSIA